jgi:aspartyl-tRNA(Asn)/glutamyl-tRNA(Gln) amidotransferase subunit A
MSWLAIADIAAKVQRGELKAADMVEQALNAIEGKKDYDAIIAPLTENARVRAKQIDEAVKNRENMGRLAGVPFIAKDNFLVFGAETTAASNMLRGFTAPYQATVINRLEAEGAICVAKANLDAFAHGSSTENSDFFTTKNPYDKTRVAGGSSGGSTAAVALEMAPFALGSDTGGSIRLPASFCGVVGLKPTYGLVSRSGVVAMASSTDSIGAIARTVEDTALVLDVMAGRDELDSTTIEREKDGYIDLIGDLKGVKVGLVKEYIESEGLEPGVKKTILAAIEKMKRAGAIIEDVSLPSLPLALAVYYVLCPAEVSSNLSRYDGQRYGYSFGTATTCPHAEHAAPQSLSAHRGVDDSSAPSPSQTDGSVRASSSPNAASLCQSCKQRQADLSLDDNYVLTREYGFGKEAKRRIMIGTHVLSSGYYDAYYKKAQVVRTKLIKEFADAFKKYDLLVGPTAATLAFEIGSHTTDPLQMYLTDIMTVAADLVGNPGISVPAGQAEGLPVGIQLMTDLREDRKLLSFAKATEELLA